SERKHRKLAGARPLERVAAGDDATADVPRLARDADRALDRVIVGLEIAIRERPVRDCRVWRDRAAAVAGEDIGAASEVPLVETEARALVVDGGSADGVDHQHRVGGG